METTKLKLENLNRFAHNLIAEARDGKLDPVIGRDEQIRRVLQILSRRTKNNPVLVGEPGVGKTAIAEGLAQRIFKKDVPENLKDKRVIIRSDFNQTDGVKYRLVDIINAQLSDVLIGYRLIYIAVIDD